MNNKCSWCGCSCYCNSSLDFGCWLW